MSLNSLQNVINTSPTLPPTPEPPLQPTDVPTTPPVPTDAPTTPPVSDEALKGIMQFQDLMDSFRDNSDKGDNAQKEYSFDINERIDNSEQGKTGNCWLLATLNCLSYSEAGQNLVNDAISVTDEGFDVEFKGINTTISVSFEELDEAKNSGRYSEGDDDVLLMEVSFEKALNMVQKEEVDAPSFVSSTANSSDKSSIDGGDMDTAIYLLTGQSSKYQYNCFHPDNNNFSAKLQRHMQWLAKLENNSMDNVYDKIEKNPDGVAATLSFFNEEGNNGEAKILDINSNEVLVTDRGGGHAWSVKSVDGDLVTIVNPWDSSKEVVCTKDEIAKYATGIRYYEFD